MLSLRLYSQINTQTLGSVLTEPLQLRLEMVFPTIEAGDWEVLLEGAKEKHTVGIEYLVLNASKCVQTVMMWYNMYLGGFPLYSSTMSTLTVETKLTIHS